MSVQLPESVPQPSAFERWQRDMPRWQIKPLVDTVVFYPYGGDVRSQGKLPMLHSTRGHCARNRTADMAVFSREFAEALLEVEIMRASRHQPPVAAFCTNCLLRQQESSA